MREILAADLDPKSQIHTHCVDTEVKIHPNVVHITGVIHSADLYNGEAPFAESDASPDDDKEESKEEGERADMKKEEEEEQEEATDDSCDASLDDAPVWRASDKAYFLNVLEQMMELKPHRK
ncbi:unnamed protein product [Polarella glacialis]|uniref:Uncharacterized protein n=1 Tax=Polarella glacialis TaxID=89957 RepID=A0A813K6F0_POLGL|nr:unnamed protein product [Polarella glacialis]CAE8703630.1 unnamed protein product [Polarella glacialis]